MCRWGRGHPEEYTENINLGEDGYDSMEDKKPRAGQILWIRGLTRLQTQVSDTVFQLYTNTNITLAQSFISYIKNFAHIHLLTPE